MPEINSPLPAVPGLVSVMMPAYNAARWIAAAVASVVAQTYPEWELLVINDGSTDGTANAVPLDDPRVRLVNQENGGEASARNHALRLSRGEFVAFLDADDHFLPDHLERTVAFLNQHPEFDAVYTDGLYIDTADQPVEKLSARRRGPFTGIIFEQFVRASDVLGPPICTLLRRSAVQHANLQFDTRIVIGPDWDFFTRLSQTANFGYLDVVTVHYRLHPASISSSTSIQRRRGYLALCRQKAIHLPGFAALSDATRSYVFYDLLINLIYDQPAHQAEVTRWPEFTGLPAAEQARLFRLLAGRAILNDQRSAPVAGWLAQSAALAPTDRRTAWLKRLYRIHPQLCKLALRLRNAAQLETSSA